MIRCKKLSFRASKTMLECLFACNRESASVWNECLRLSKEYYLETGTWITKTILQKQTKGRFLLHSQSVQSVVHKYLEARQSASKARKKGLHNKYPYKKKHHYPTCWVQSAFRIHENGKVELSMGRGRSPIVVYIDAGQLPSGSIKEIELVYDRKLCLSFCFDNGQKEPDSVPEGTTIGVDLGEIHTIAAYSLKEESLIITGRKLRSIHRLRNKKLAELQRLLSKCKKGSRQWKKYLRAKQYVLSKSDKQLQDAVHKSTKRFVDWCVAQQTKEVVCGNPEGVQRNTRKHKKGRRRTNQKLSNWLFGKVKKYLAYKLKAEGIRFILTDEAYTSQTCPSCGKRKKTSSRNYTCACGYTMHRDVHGAHNIASKHLHGRFIVLGSIKKHTYLRIA
jgi:putative transposase